MALDPTDPSNFVKMNKWNYFDLIGYKPHPRQRLFHQSEARFKVPICGRRFGKSVMAARELTPNLFLPNRRYWIVGPCVDENTEVLTQRGWLRYTELVVGDYLLTLNDSGLAEWQICEKVNTYPGIHRMIHIKQRGHDSLTTPHHRWLVGYTSSDGHGGRRDSGFRFVTTETMTKPNEYVLGGASVVNLPTEPKYADDLVELVGWYWSEGTDQTASDGLLITQNSGPNSDRIRAAAFGVFGPSSDSGIMRNRYDLEARWSDWKPITGQDKCGRFGFNSHAGRIIREIAPDKVINNEFIVSLTRSQLELLLDVSVKADGHERIRSNGARERVIVQDRKDRLSQLQMAAQLAGYQTTLLYDKVGQRYRLTIFERSRMWLGQKPAVAKRTEIAYEGTVWCPTTPNGTWLARRNGTVYFTGNTYDLGEKEFRVIWNDLIIKLGLGRQREIKRSYSKKQGDLSIEFPWGTKLEVRSADRPDNLVGEGLHGVIMSEAAKHSEETWNRFIRPALTDFRGSALFPTTPEGQNWLYELWKMGRNPEYPEFESWQFPSWENPFVYPLGKEDPEILLTKKTTPEEEFLQEYGADFTNFSGKIYKEWDEGTHVQAVPFVPNLPNYIAFDWGYTAPMAAVEFQIDAFGRVRVWREHYKAHTRLRDFLNELRSRPQPEGYHLDLTFGDAADPEAVVTVSEDFCPCYADPRSKSGTQGGSLQSGWREGIELVKGLLKLQEVDQDEYGTPIEQPWLVVDHSCYNIIREFNNYRAAKAVRDKDPREMAHSSDDHALDALRYGLMHYFKLGATASLSDVMDVTSMTDLPDTGYFTSGKSFA